MVWAGQDGRKTGLPPRGSVTGQNDCVTGHPGGVTGQPSGVTGRTSPAVTGASL